MATQELEGKPCIMGTRNCRQPDQWPMSSIIEIRLKMRMNTDAMFRNCNGVPQPVSMGTRAASREMVLTAQRDDGLPPAVWKLTSKEDI